MAKTDNYIWQYNGWIQPHTGKKFVIETPGNPVDPTTPTNPTNPTTPAVTLVERLDLPFNIPTQDVLFNTTKKIWYHYFLSFPIAYTTSQNSPTAPDVDTRLNADGTPISPSNIWSLNNPPGRVAAEKVYGGLVRDRPFYMRAPRPTITSPTLPTKKLDFRIQDKITEIYQAIVGGGDGFAINLLDIPDNAGQYDLTISETAGGAPLRWRQTVELYEACAEVNRAAGKTVFQMLLMPDGSTGGTKAPAANLANAIDWLETNYPGTNYLRNGKVVVAPYQPEVAPAYTNSTPEAGVVDAFDYWNGVINGLKAKGYGTYFWPCYSRLWSDVPQQPKFKTITQGVSRWGARMPGTVSAESEQERRFAYAVKRDYPGNEVMWPVAISDERPNQTKFDECDHFEGLKETWITAIGDATAFHLPVEMVQVPTWSDYAEGAMIAPTVNREWCPLDVSMYYLIKWKTGTYPDIVRDTLYLSHRIQPTDDVATITYTGGQTSLMTKRTGGTATQNTVGVLCFLTAPADVTVNIGGRISTHLNVPAGVTTLRDPLLPIGTGLVSCSATRGGNVIAQVTSSEARRVRTTLVSQDMAYRMASSRASFKTPTGLSYTPKEITTGGATSNPTPTPTPDPTPTPTPVTITFNSVRTPISNSAPVPVAGQSINTVNPDRTTL